ncbi:MAG: dihydrofolate reductase family protein [Polyangiales bacterium]
MRTILWATLSANGNYARSTPRNPPKQEALADFAELTRTHGNFVVGRRTFEEFQARAGAPMAKTDIVVVSTTLTIPAGAPATSAKDPRAALAVVRERGHETAVVVGGERLHNACLAEGLVDELVLVIAPSFEDEGLKIVLPRGQRRDAELLESKALGGGVMRLRYALGKADAW